MTGQPMIAGAAKRLEAKLLPGAASPEGLSGIVTGYASLFDVPDLGRDVVAPGAFAESLARRGPAGIRMLWQHDPAEPVGRWLSLAEDKRGLKVRGRLNLAVGRARELHALLCDGSVDGLSIGFRTVEAARDKRTGLRRLVRIDLWEVSLVTFPMLPGARATVGEPVRPPTEIRSVPPALAPAIRRATARLLVTSNRSTP